MVHFYPGTAILDCEMFEQEKVFEHELTIPRGPPHACRRQDSGIYVGSICCSEPVYIATAVSLAGVTYVY